MKPFAALVSAALVIAAFPLAAADPQFRTTVANRDPGPVRPDVAQDDDPSRNGRQVSPQAGTTSSVVVTVTALDDNGFNDLASVRVTVYKPDNSTVHVAERSAGRTSGSGKQASFSTTFSMNFHDDPGVYPIKVVASDRKNSQSIGWASFEFSRLAAVGFSASSLHLHPGGSADGSVAPGSSTHADPSPLIVHNRGNVLIDLRYDATALTSGSNSIAADNVHFSASSSMTDERTLDGTLRTDTSFDLGKGASASRELWFAVHVPEGTPAGEYTGSLTLAAVEGG